MLNKINWRLKTIINKLLFREPYLPWNILISEIFSKHTGLKYELDFDEYDENFVLVKFPDGSQLFWPKKFGLKTLEIVFFELSTENPNNYFQFYQPKKTDIVFDVGACEGLFTYKIKDKVSKVFLFEPIPDLSNALGLTFKNEIANGKVKIFNFGLGSENLNDVIFNINTENIGGSSFEKQGINQSENYKIFTSIRTLDSFIDEYKKEINKIDLIKVDIEGFEINFLKGATRAIEKYKPNLLVCSYHNPDDYINIKNFLKYYGYNFKHSKPVWFLDGKLPAWRYALIYAYK
ncbi:FkbM family methyltransferase [Carboxydothermus ferrireducens]|uniref:FkbM family methyltransferase n=1 Tax=Carboxydothermus ferrireducens DSM 11255 TaxID=1119529 RepID=A0ABX2R709_9THEO|nr:FkbM family methyltransferase [Carboxydothermus ferrireducens]NYE56939.1 FkbM family methyltransferase [Carboxydothermus ferrireducens DSM 11255]